MPRAMCHFPLVDGGSKNREIISNQSWPRLFLPFLKVTPHVASIGPIAMSNVAPPGLSGSWGGEWVMKSIQVGLEVVLDSGSRARQPQTLGYLCALFWSQENPADHRVPWV